MKCEKCKTLIIGNDFIETGTEEVGKMTKFYDYYRCPNCFKVCKWLRTEWKTISEKRKKIILVCYLVPLVVILTMLLIYFIVY